MIGSVMGGEANAPLSVMIYDLWWFDKSGDEELEATGWIR